MKNQVSVSTQKLKKNVGSKNLSITGQKRQTQIKNVEGQIRIGKEVVVTPDSSNINPKSKSKKQKTPHSAPAGRVINQAGIAVSNKFDVLNDDDGSKIVGPGQ